MGMIRRMIPVVHIRVVLTYLAMSFGRPQSSYSCTDNEAAIQTAPGTVICWKVPNCPHGFGLSFEHKPGYIHSSESIKVKCEPCKSGSTYSNTHDFSQCKNCTQCKEKEIFTGICKQSKDEIHCTGVCKEGFYWANATASCITCSQCCRDGNNSGCAESCPPELSNKNCTSTANGTHGTSNANGTHGSNGNGTHGSNANGTHGSNANGTQSNNITHTDTNSTSPSNGKIPRDHEDNVSPKDDVNTKGSLTPGQLALAILCPPLLIFCVFLICLYCKARRAQPGNRPGLHGINCDNIVLPRFTKLHLSSAESTEVDCFNNDEVEALGSLQGTVPMNLGESCNTENGTDCQGEANKNQVGFLVNICPNVEEVDMSLEEGLQICQYEVPMNLDESYNAENGTVCQGEANNKVELKDVCSKVKDMLRWEREEICQKLNQRNSFYLDYRTLGTSLGMENTEVDQLLHESSPTECILQKYKETDLEFFRQEVREIEKDLEFCVANGIIIFK